jgi:esterase/lipase
MKARRLVNGLLPELHLMVKPHNDQTWTAALDRAKAYELTYQNQKSVTAYMNKYVPNIPNTQTNELSNAITTLTQQFSQLMTNLSTQQNQQDYQNQYNQPRRNYQNNYQNNY